MSARGCLVPLRGLGAPDDPAKGASSLESMVVVAAALIHQGHIDGGSGGLGNAKRVEDPILFSEVLAGLVVVAKPVIGGDFSVGLHLFTSEGDNHSGGGLDKKVLANGP